MFQSELSPAHSHTLPHHLHASSTRKPRQSRFCDKADGGRGVVSGSLRVAGMVGPERTTTLRGYDPREEDGSHLHRMHLHLHLHRSRSSESVLVSDERIRGSAPGDVRYGHPRLSNHDHYRYDHARYSSGSGSGSGHPQHVYAFENCDDHGGAGVGVIGGGTEIRGGNGGHDIFFGERYCDDDALRQQRHQQHRGHGGGGGVGSRPENHQDSARLLLLPGSVDRGGDQDGVPRFDSQRQHRLREGASRSWNHNGSPSLPPQVPCLSSRRSDGGSVATVGSARGGFGGGVVSRGLGGFGGVHHGGSGGFSSVDGVRDDISRTVSFWINGGWGQGTIILLVSSWSRFSVLCAYSAGGGHFVESSLPWSFIRLCVS